MKILKINIWKMKIFINCHFRKLIFSKRNFNYFLRSNWKTNFRNWCFRNLETFVGWKLKGWTLKVQRVGSTDSGPDLWNLWDAVEVRTVRRRRSAVSNGFRGKTRPIIIWRPAAAAARWGTRISNSRDANESLCACCPKRGLRLDSSTCLPDSPESSQWHANKKK